MILHQSLTLTALKMTLHPLPPRAAVVTCSVPQNTVGVIFAVLSLGLKRMCLLLSLGNPRAQAGLASRIRRGHVGQRHCPAKAILDQPAPCRS